MATQAKTDAPELTLDAQSQTGFVKWFKGLGQDPQLIRFFDRKGFYSCHGDNALLVARTFYRTTAVVKYLGAGGGGGGGGTPSAGAQGLPSVTLSRGLYETVLRDLLLEGGQHSVELWDGYGAHWKVAKSASPGRLSAFEEELFRGGEAADAPLVAAVALGYAEGQRTVGAAFLDPGGRRLGACQFVDDEHFCSLEALLVQLGAREVVIQKGPEPSDAATPGKPAGGAAGGAGAAGAAADRRRLGDVLGRVGAMGSERARGLFAAKHLEQDLGKLLKSETVEQHRDVLERPQACAALSALLAFTELTADAAGLGKYSLALHDPGRFMRLDAAAQRALHVFPARGDANGAFSLYGLMCRARTAMGKRRLKVWLKQPLVSAPDITARLDVVEALSADATLRDAVRDALRGMPDIERLARKLEARRISLSELCQLYRASSALPRLEDALRCHEGPAAALLAERFAAPLAAAHDEEHLSKFEMLLEASIDLDRVPEEYVISAAYDPRLQAMRDSKDAVEDEIQRIAQAAAKDLGLVLDKTVKLEWHKAANARTRCLRITQKEEKAVRSRLQAKYKLLETRKDGTKFTNNALRDAAERLGAAAGKYEDLQRDLVAQVVAVAHTFVEVWEGVISLVAELDVLAGFAELACGDPTRPYVRPVILGADDAEEVSLEGCRHPCVEAQEGVAFVANDCKLVKGSSWFTIVTGPNMGGKSTFIRQVGVAVLMAQVGCFVPCAAARISPRDAIFARVGAGDCQLRGVSTFMAEMLESAAILKGATARSLVIIDELGRGTSTYDGFGLAWAIGEYIMHTIGAPTLFATHFHELTDISGPGGVANRHVGTRIEPDTGKLTMLYEIREGACDQSFGIHVAESAAFPAAVVAAARRKLAELEGAAAAGAAGAGGGAGKRKREDGGEGGGGGEGMDVDAAAAGGGDQGAERSAAAAAARAFLSEFASLPAEQLRGPGGAAAAAKLLAGLEEGARGNAALRRLLEG
ncbi:MAG: DNA mismatch repair protein [Monoraphidium minutum]|nr:MAG: DNA mismatch repair protein [Monoraphidium minutum]